MGLEIDINIVFNTFVIGKSKGLCLKFAIKHQH